MITTVLSTAMLCHDSPYRIQVMYQGGNLAKYRPVIEKLVTDTNSLFKQQGKALRLVTESNCHLSIKPLKEWHSQYFIQGPPNGRVDHKYLVFTHDTGYPCGQAQVYNDSRPGQNNLNNGNRKSAGIIRQCGWNVETVAHETMHLLGAVQNDSPRSTKEFHCYAVGDIMCRPTVDSRICPGFFSGTYRRKFDCFNDSYFSLKPRGYLKTHWNTANSRFLS